MLNSPQILLDLSSVVAGSKKSEKLTLDPSLRHHMEAELSLIDLKGLHVTYTLFPRQDNIIELQLALSCTAVQANVNDLSDFTTQIKHNVSVNLYPSDREYNHIPSTQYEEWDIYFTDTFDIYPLIIQEIQTLLPHTPGEHPQEAKLRA